MQLLFLGKESQYKVSKYCTQANQPDDMSKLTMSAKLAS